MLTQLKENKWLEVALVFLLGVACYALHFHHYFSSFGTDIFFFNDPDDAKVYSWNTWHFAHQIKQGNFPFYTNYICSPNGTSLWMHAYTVWFGMLNLFLGNVALSINLGIAIQLVLAFIGFYYFAKRFVFQSYFASMVAYISVFNTYVLAKCGVHYNLVLIGVLPFLLLYIVKVFPRTEETARVGKKHWVVLICLLVVAFFMDYYIVFYAFAFLLVYLVWFSFLSKWFETWNWKKSIGILSLFGVGHIVLRLLRIVGFDSKGAIWGAADLRLLLTPGRNAANFRNWVLEEIPNSVNDNKIFIGISLLVFFLVALVLFFQNFKRDEFCRFFLFASVVFLLVTLPVFKIGENVMFYNFTSIVHFIPFVNHVRAPDRFILLFFVSAAIFIGRVLFLKTGDINHWKKYVGLAMVLFVWFYVEHQQQVMRPISMSVPDKSVLSEMNGKKVLMLPFGIRDGYQQFGEFDENQLLLQQKYGFKMPNGYLSRLSDDTWNYNKENEFYKNLVLLQNDSAVVDYDWGSALEKEGIEAIYFGTKLTLTRKQLTRILIGIDSKVEGDVSGSLHVISDYHFDDTLFD